MKKYRIYAAGISALLLIAGCSKDENLKNDLPEETLLTITAEQSNEPSTRLAYTDDGTNIALAWEGTGRTDAFAVYTGGEIPLTFTFGAIKSGTNGTVASFTAVGIDPGGGTYLAVYPAVKAQNTQSTLDLNVLGQIQTGNGTMDHLADFNFMTSSFTATGSIEDAQATFSPLVSVLKFKITAPSSSVQPTSLTLSTPTNQGIVIRQSGGTLSTPGYAKSITLSLNSVTLAADNTFTAYVAVFGGTTLAGQDVAVNVNYNDGSVYTYSMSSASGTPLVAGKVYTKTLTTGTGGLTELPAISVLTTSTTASNSLMPDGSGNRLIQSAADLLYFLQTVNLGDNAANYLLTTDILVESGVSWVPIGTDNEPFNGVFDGGGHTISGALISATETYFGFFGVIQGSQPNPAVVKNLNIAADVNAAATEFVYAGCVVGDTRGYVNINNCVVSGNISIPGDPSGSVNTDVGGSYVGGIAGALRSAATMTDCAMTGRTSSSEGNYTYIGGGVGYNTGKMTNCSNYGTVTLMASVENVLIGRVGGIVGYNNGGTIINAWSKGDVIYPDPITFPAVEFGGLVGNNKGTLTHCHNDNKPVIIDDVGINTGIIQ